MEQLLGCHFVVHGYRAEDVLLQQSDLVGSSKTLHRLLRLGSCLEGVMHWFKPGSH
jgi:hypothetical protein